MLKHGLFLGRVNVDALVFLVDLVTQLSLDFIHGQLLLVEALLLFSDFVHIFELFNTIK
jgi:hypothetical protein